MAGGVHLQEEKIWRDAVKRSPHQCLGTFQIWGEGSPKNPRDRKTEGETETGRVNTGEWQVTTVTLSSPGPSPPREPERKGVGGGGRGVAV